MTKIVSEISLLVVPEDPLEDRYTVEAGVPFEHPHGEAEVDESHPYFAVADSPRGKAIRKRFKNLGSADDAPDAEVVVNPDVVEGADATPPEEAA